MTVRYLNTREVSERYGCSRNTAANYMRSMEHMEKPLMVREDVLRAWEAERTRAAGERYETPKKRRKVVPMIPRAMVAADGKHIVQRTRPTQEAARKRWEQVIKAL